MGNIMGSFITNLHVRGADRSAVIAALRSLDAVPAYVRDSPETAWTSIYPEAAGQDEAVLPEMARALSKALQRPVVAFIVHDSDILLYWLCDDGEQLDRYNSAPGYFTDEDEATPPEGGNPDALTVYCLPGASPDRLLRLLHTEEFLFAEHRLMELAKILGIPDRPANDSYHYLVEGQGAPGSLTLVQAEGEESIRLE
jgi:hypothetical protein